MIKKTKKIRRGMRQKKREKRMKRRRKGEDTDYEKIEGEMYYKSNEEEGRRNLKVNEKRAVEKRRKEYREEIKQERRAKYINYYIKTDLICSDIPCLVCNVSRYKTHQFAVLVRLFTSYC
jgi:hypothetical protein